MKVLPSSLNDEVDSLTLLCSVHCIGVGLVVVVGGHLVAAGCSVAHLTRAATCRPPASPAHHHWLPQPSPAELIGRAGALVPPLLAGWLGRRVAGCLARQDWFRTRVEGAPAGAGVYKLRDAEENHNSFSL